MSILHYFKPDSVSRSDGLPNPFGSLSTRIPPAAIASANEQVQEAQKEKARSKRGPYHKFSAVMRARIGRYASENGVAAAARRYSREIKVTINESTVRGIRRTYLTELNGKRAGDDDFAIGGLPTKKRGRPLLLGSRLDAEVQSYLVKVRECGGAVNTAITMAGAKGLLLKLDRTQLQEYGGPVTLSRAWAKSLMRRMGFVKRRGTTKCKATVENFDQVKADFLAEVASTVQMEEIPPELIFNWDQTGIHLVPVASWTMERQGAKHVEVAGITDKRQITAVFCGSLVGEFLPVQLIYPGKTKRCHANYNFPADWHITQSPKHWSNEDTMLDYIDLIIAPFVSRVRDDLGVGKEQAALAIFDHFKGQLTKHVFEHLEEHNIQSVLIPANCTDQLQPMDLSINRAAKSFLEREFQDWYSKAIMKQMEDGSHEPLPVDLSSVNMKHAGAQWLVRMYEHISSCPHLVVNGFLKAGISQAIDGALTTCNIDDHYDLTSDEELSDDGAEFSD